MWWLGGFSVLWLPAQVALFLQAMKLTPGATDNVVDLETCTCVLVPDGHGEERGVVGPQMGILV